LIKQGVSEPSLITAAGPRFERGKELADRYGIAFGTENGPASKEADIVVLSVKPQRLAKVLVSLRDHVRRDALVLSIVAGASISGISAGMNHVRIVRAMPNTPAQIGEGISVWTAAPEVSDEQIEQAKIVLGAMGEQIQVEEENYLDMATALSGTGPAYVFLFMEAMIDAGVHLGFPRRIAEQLVRQTVRGSVDFYIHRDVHVARLRNEVTSPGGTTAAALYFLEKAGFRTAISRAVWAAYERSRELGSGGNAHAPEKPQE
ncbi:MAG TPA: pyrroline-5-carboxylate reductase, partial [Chloroflexi bacterium]|nr:pyrroline-5-carboxylate reductase [Chloroflexota bacterium]